MKIDMFGSLSTTTTTEKKSPLPSPPVVATPQETPFSAPPQDYVYDEAWSILVDGLLDKIHCVEEDLVMVERAILKSAGRSSSSSTQQLWGVTWNFQDQEHIDNVITSLLCNLDAIDIPQQAVFLRSQPKQFVKRIEGLTDLWKPVSSSSSSKKKKKSTTTRRVVSSSSTPTKKEKLLAARARARQWSYTLRK